MVKLTLLFCSSLTIMSGATIAPSLPQMADAYSFLPKADFLAKLVLTIPAIFIAVGAPIAGWVVDRFGRKPLLLVAIVLFGFTGTAGFYLTDINHILISRALLGISVAAVMTAATTLIGDYFEGKERSQFMGFQGGMMALGGVVFILAGGFLADIDWRYPFLVYGLSFAFLPFVFVYIKEPNLAIPTAGGGNIDLRIWRLKYLVVYAIAFTGMVIFYTVPVQLPFYLKSLNVESNAQTGIAIAIGMVAGATASLNYQRIHSKASFKLIYALAFILMAIGYVIISISFSFIQVVVGLAISGFGVGLTFPNASLWLMSITPEAIRGRIMGGLSGVTFLGQFFSPFLTSPITKSVGQASMFGVLGFLMLVMSIIFVVAERKRPKSSARKT